MNMALPLLPRLAQVLGGIARLVAPDEPEVERVCMSSNLYRLSKAGTVNVVDLVLPLALDIEEFDKLNE